MTQKQYRVFEDCVARYEGHDLLPTEWQGFPIHHTDPFWNADLFYEPQYQAVNVLGSVFEVRGDYADDDVLMRAFRGFDGLMLEVKDTRGARSIWLEPPIVESFRDFINTTK